MNEAAPAGANMDFALIGNCQTAALVDRRARIVWWCFPRFDSDPVFSRLLAGDEEKGFCEVALADLAEVKTQYLRNTAVVETVLTDTRGGAVRVTDFAPRFDLFGRTYRAPQIVRRIEPIVGLPRVTIRVRPTCNYGQPVEEVSAGSHHIRYIGGGAVMRLTTDAPIAYIIAESAFPLSRTLNLVFGQDDPLRNAIDDQCREFLERTCDHWRNWVRGLDVAVRMAVGGHARRDHASNSAPSRTPAASSPRIRPRSPRRRARARNWDYRYCWLRDAFFVVQALNRLGATQTMESYINYFTAIATRDGAALRSGAWRRALRQSPGNDDAGAEGVSRPRPGAHRQPGRRADPARRLWQRRARRGADVHRRASAAHGRRRAVRRTRGAWRARRGNSPSSPTPASGNIAAARASTPIRALCAGRPATGSAGSRGGSASPSARANGRSAPLRSASGCWRAPGIRSAACSPARSARPSSTPACCCSPNSACCRPTTRASAAPATRSAAICCATAA